MTPLARGGERVRVDGVYGQGAGTFARQLRRPRPDARDAGAACAWQARLTASPRLRVQRAAARRSSTASFMSTPDAGATDGTSDPGSKPFQVPRPRSQSMTCSGRSTGQSFLLRTSASDAPAAIRLPDAESPPSPLRKDGTPRGSTTTASQISALTARVAHMQASSRMLHPARGTRLPGRRSRKAGKQELAAVLVPGPRAGCAVSPVRRCPLGHEALRLARRASARTCPAAAAGWHGLAIIPSAGGPQRAGRARCRS